MWIYILYLLYMRWHCPILSLTCCTSGCCNTDNKALWQMGRGGLVRKLQGAFLFAGVLRSFMKILMWWWGIKCTVKPPVFNVVCKTDYLSLQTMQLMFLQKYIKYTIFPNILWHAYVDGKLRNAWYTVIMVQYKLQQGGSKYIRHPQPSCLFSCPPTHAESFMCKADRWSQLTC